MYEDLSPLTPAIVISSQRPILSVRLPDKHIAGTLQSLCDAVQLDRASQLERIRRSRLLNKQLILVPVLTKGGWQQMDVLIAWAIPIWLSGIHLTRLTPEKQQLVLALQETIVDDLYRYYAELDAKEIAQIVIEQEQLPESDVAPKEWVEAEPFSPLPDDIWERQYQAMAGFEREWRAVKDDIAALNAHLAQVSADLAEMKVDLAALKAAQAQESAGAVRQADDRLSPDHFLHLYVLARSLESRTGEPLGAVMRELAAAFQVRDVGELPDSAWDGVLAWFWQHGQR